MESRPVTFTKEGMEGVQRKNPNRTVPSLISLQVCQAVDQATESVGFCFKNFIADITIDRYQMPPTNTLLKSGDLVLYNNFPQRKRCWPECELLQNKLPCPLTHLACATPWWWKNQENCARGMCSQSLIPIRSGSQFDAEHPYQQDYIIPSSLSENINLRRSGSKPDNKKIYPIWIKASYWQQKILFFRSRVPNLNSTIHLSWMKTLSSPSISMAPHQIIRDEYSYQNFSK